MAIGKREAGWLMMLLVFLQKLQTLASLRFDRRTFTMEPLIDRVIAAIISYTAVERPIAVKLVHSYTLGSQTLGN